MIKMTQTHKKRLALVLLLVAGASTTVTLAVYAFRSNMLYYFSPSEIKDGKAPVEQTIRVGGLVTKGSVQRASDNLLVTFEVTDTKETLTIQYEGILPDLFREGQGIIAIGKMQTDGSFLASEVLAKHDENYMPPEVAHSLKPSASTVE